MFDTRRMAMVAVAPMAATRAAGGDDPAAPAGPEPVPDDVTVVEPPRSEPLAITADEILDLYRNLNGGGKALGPDDYAGCLVRFPATLIDRIATHEGGTLVLASGRSTVTALLPREAYDAVRSVEAGSRVEITGIVDIAFSDDTYDRGFGQLHDWRPARVDRFSLRVTRADDVVVTQPPPWWTPRRLAIALGATGVAIGGALAWVALLRRQVKVNSAQLAAEAQDRQAARWRRACGTTAAASSGAAGAAEKKLLVVESPVALSADVKVVPGQTLRVEPGGMIEIPKGLTLTIEGRLEAGAYRIFSGEGTLTGPANIERIYPEWFFEGAYNDESVERPRRRGTTTCRSGPTFRWPSPGRIPSW